MCSGSTMHTDQITKTIGLTDYESRETQIKIKIEKEAIHQFCTEFSFLCHVVLKKIILHFQSPVILCRTEIIHPKIEKRFQIPPTQLRFLKKVKRITHKLIRHLEYCDTMLSMFHSSHEFE